MGELTRRDVTERAGVDLAEVDRLVEAGIITPDTADRFTAGDVRRVMLMRTFEEAGLPFEILATATRNRQLSLEFVDAPAYERFTAFSDETFEQASKRTGVPLELLMVIREAIGAAPPRPTDRVREDEMAVVAFVEHQHASGFRQSAIERLLRAYGDNLRRIAESEADWWRSEVITPGLAAGASASDVAGGEMADRMSELAERALVSVYRAMEMNAWTANIVDGLEHVLAQAGLHVQRERQPAICFLDITGYTRLTQEQGDAAAADLAERLGRLVQRTSVQNGGRPVKYLGDGVMFLFAEPGPAVLAALEMVDGVASAGLPPAHVGIHTGPVVFQEGDYYGQTVNIASRIADYARPGEVLVSEDVVAAAGGDGALFVEIGPVELKGVSGTVRLYVARGEGASSGTRATSSRLPAAQILDHRDADRT